jgi:streptogramin lyase
MILQLRESTKIDNLRNYPEEIVEKLRLLLVAGAVAHPDPSRANFYDIENGSRLFYVHLTPSGSVWLLASWLKGETQGAMVNQQAVAVQYA